MTSASLRAEPFRLFFPLALVLGVTGVAHWILYTTGAIASYLARFHAVTQTQAFLVAFAAGFLLTAVPKRTRTLPASWIEIGILLALLPVVSLATLLDAPVVGQIAYAATLLVLAQFAIRRFAARDAGRRPPASFAMVPIGLLAGLASAALTSVGLGDDAPTWMLALGRRLAFEGVFLCLVLGIGAFFLPLSGRGEGAPDLDKGHRLAIPGYLAAGLSILAGLALEAAGSPRIGALLRGVVALGVIVASGAFRPPSRPGANRWLVWIAVWALPLGLLGAAVFPDQRIEALHVVFLGGFGLLAFAVSTHVVLGHTDNEAAQSGRPWPVLAFGALFAVAMVLRAGVTTMPEHYFGWLGLAASLWIAGATAWAILVLPKLWRAPDEPPRPA
ncbi:MAG: NnrS family protein [Byssovorax sp.]